MDCNWHHTITCNPLKSLQQIFLALGYKKNLFLLFALLITFSSSIAQSKFSSDVYVRGYTTRKDVTVVPGHYRLAPNRTIMCTNKLFVYLNYNYE